MHDPAAHHRQYRRQLLDARLGNRVIVFRERNEVRELPDLDRALSATLRREPGAAFGVQAQRGLAIDQVALRVQAGAADRLAGNQPVQPDPGVVAGDARRVGAHAERHAGSEDLLHRRCLLGGARAVAFDETLALVGHAVLDRDPAAERPHALDVAVPNRLGVIDDPVQARQRHLGMHALEHIEHACDRFVVGRVDAERPAVDRQRARDIKKLLLHRACQFRPRLAEVFEVGGREHQHFTGAVVTQKVVAIAGLDQPGPLNEVFFLPLRPLREQVVGDANRELAGIGQLLDDLVVVGVVLETTAGIDHRCDTEPIELAHVQARRVDLVFRAQHRPLGQRGVQQHRVRARDEQAGGHAVRIALDLPAGRIRRVARVPHGAQCRRVEQSPVVEMQDEDRRVGRSGVDLLQGRQALLGKLELAEASDHPHPLGRGRALHLRAQHRHRVGQRRHAVPPQLHVVVEPRPYEVGVAVVQARHDTAIAEVDAPCRWAGVRQDLGRGADREDDPVVHGDGLDLRALRVERRDAPVNENDIGRLSHAGHSERSKACETNRLTLPPERTAATGSRARRAPWWSRTRPPCRRRRSGS